MALGGERRVDGLSVELLHVERRGWRRLRNRQRDGRRAHLLAVDHAAAAAAVGRVTWLSEHGPGLGGVRNGTAARTRGPIARGHRRRTSRGSVVVVPRPPVTNAAAAAALAFRPGGPRSLVADQHRRSRPPVYIGPRPERRIPSPLGQPSAAARESVGKRVVVGRRHARKRTTKIG